MWPFGKSTADRVKDALNEQPRLKDLGLQVQERGGTVSVSGMVPNTRYMNLIRVVAEGINGVKTVDLSGVTAQEEAAAPAQPAPATPQATVTEIAPTTIAPTTGNMNASAGSTDMDAEIKQVEDRSRVAKAVLSAIRSNGELADDPIDVLQSGSSVILRGVVDNDHEKRLLEQVARGVDGVSGVDISGVRVAQGARELAKEKDQDSGDTVYTVKPGDSLSAIAQKFYGDPMEYKKIAHYNNISNPDLIHPGDRLRIPG
ncbi:BON domain-containing protein [Deinococcus soli (ex Cha et al. 2016)]|uniref:Nucleoid-associated protein YgaU n=2 Tax=Deinococcus soli (ex Cha et al. 2016) TaxID=1309411 RepID=A0ACC6KIN4_9DEIO|nr:BON domain-containing protein [Deinococcus soli (ex Cha et al. 2016)]MDR6219472.1 nucleoid-associated protein YgaU [Deinococcus soli (ex Cha et al. 2016)]MDR6327151.1 nucleoid-associated protein YgaU [Deinococcus soli (ex Cha et al. 2016)]MDR6752383.1 nucleoid-associated protein YgaU [Deinococcus soli (ex Cha et al. 2016)]